MRKIYMMGICVGLLSINVHAQTLENMESMIQSLTSGNTANISNIVGNVAETLMETVVLVPPQTSAIEGQLVVETVIPEINRTGAEVLIGDDREGRYAPRLKINFSEYPLRTPTDTHGKRGIVAESLALRLQNRLRIPQVGLVIQERTALLSGTAETERQRDLIELMLLFEPGIDAVKNDITIK